MYVVRNGVTVPYVRNWGTVPYVRPHVSGPCLELLQIASDRRNDHGDPYMGLNGSRDARALDICKDAIVDDIIEVGIDAKTKKPFYVNRKTTAPNSRSMSWHRQDVVGRVKALPEVAATAASIVNTDHICANPECPCTLGKHKKEVLGGNKNRTPLEVMTALEKIKNFFARFIM